MSEKKNREDSTVGRNNPGRDAIGAAMRFITSITGSDFAQKYDLQPTIDRVIYQSTKSGFKTLGAANRQFKKVAGSGKPQRPARDAQAAAPDDAASAEPAKTPSKKLFDLTPTEDQQMIVETVKEFAESRLRDAAAKCDHEATPPETLLSEAAELGVSLINVPESFEGIATGEDVTTNALVAEALAYGDMGLALTVLAPAGVAATLTAHGSDAQQKTYLPAFAGEDVPAAAVVLSEPRPLFDPLEPETTGRREGNEIVLNGVKSMVPNAGAAELFIVGVNLNGRPALVIVESDTEGLHVEADPSMGVRGAALGRLVLKDVRVPADAILGGEQISPEQAEIEYRDVLRRSRLGWAALAAGTSQAILDYVVPYVNEREAFGEPISHRQAVAFMVADIKIELDGLRMILLRGTSRADQGRRFDREAALAKNFATEKGMKIGSDGVQLLGGHGFVKEHPVERWYRDLRAVGVAEGIVVL
ncbi:MULTISPECIES: acyl-CoA dehydrogenase family protein [Corynebacterium]|uniref:Alkylation response protein AidB-like acyl-CoA dehydrogenase n=1 Tax=Corynebacterium freneyi TaxID=134034 RepID=A0ABS4U4Q5_9CORY|nr:MULTISPECIES: acyl-CoA dehydrogenase family protein [Corynebacterium]MBP2331623.1 alkylation response protein AidB-like acyl-CoA dehydrogenase [Corynebacterium freneyi]MCG7439487.1 acyl-CoA dehydrogenase family protein [Corynebacterium freneyi]OFU55801.1 butyryl-CoA dehydrogenase [Corynebacterium sp. HMSC11E11]QXA51919.1 acyl-CoA dehydrogenase family protein [Corynebacterium freneyi]UBI02117.1 acyl-CoA dehydrogenase family protein [Corynebacterium freneyi]